MIWFSTRHDASYADMAAEMIRHAGFQDSVNDRLRLVVAAGGCGSVSGARSVDDLYQIYGDEGVIDG